VLTRRRFGRSLLASGGALVPPLAGIASLAGCGRRERAPEVAYTLLDGRAGHTAEHRGAVMLVNFWATSCVACMQEMPTFVATWHKYRPQGFEVLAVAMSYDPPAQVAHFAETRALPFGVVIDNTGAFARSFGDVSVTPTTFVIDKRGGIARRYVGAPDVAELHRRVEGLLAEA
jgi:peroxiredoxin